MMIVYDDDDYADECDDYNDDDNDDDNSDCKLPLECPRRRVMIVYHDCI